MELISITRDDGKTKKRTGSIIDNDDWLATVMRGSFWDGSCVIDRGDITAEYNSEQIELTQHQENIISAKAMLNNINNSTKPAWEKKLLKTLIRHNFGK